MPPVVPAKYFTSLAAMPIPSRLLTLPAEVRLLIYAHLFAGAILRPCYQLKLRSASTHQPKLKTTAIIATCRLCQTEALPIFFKTCRFKLMSSADKHAFLSSVPVSQYASIQYLILDAHNVLFDWTPGFIARKFPSLKLLQIPAFHISSPGSPVTGAMPEDSGTCTAVLQERFGILRKRLESRGRRFPRGGRLFRNEGMIISAHTEEERRSYDIVLKTRISFGGSYPRTSVVSTLAG
jgi:hypothetical protein